MTPTFGQTLRAARLGWHWSYRHEAFIRISTVDDDLIRIEMCKPDQLPNRTQKQQHRIWWEQYGSDVSPDDLLAMCQALAQRCPLSVPSVTFYVNNDGVEIP